MFYHIQEYFTPGDSEKGGKRMIWVDPVLIKLSGRRQDLANGHDDGCSFGAAFVDACSDGSLASGCSEGIGADSSCAPGTGRDGSSSGCDFGDGDTG